MNKYPLLTIYSKDNCQYCTRAKNLMTAKGIIYTEQKLDRDFTIDQLKEKFPDAKSFPIIEISERGYLIGGYNELETWVNEWRDLNEQG